MKSKGFILSLSFIILPTIVVMAISFFLSLSFGAILLYEGDYDEGKVEVVAYISDIKRDTDGSGGDTYVTYSYNGENYESHLNYFSSGQEIGDKVKILVEPGEYDFVYTKSNNGLTIFLVSFLVFIIFFIFLILEILLVVRGVRDLIDDANEVKEEIEDSGF